MNETDVDNWYWEKTWSDFRTGDLRVGLSWPGGSASGKIFNQGTPETAAAILSKLPLRVPIVHVMWSGEMLMSTQSFDIGVKKEENRVRLVRPGDMTFDPKHGELAFTYGMAECKLPTGDHALTVYGCIDENLEGFAKFGRARRFEGASYIDIAVANPAVEIRREL